MKALIPGLFFLPFGIACSTSWESKYGPSQGHCNNFIEVLGPSHQCSLAEGGALDEFELRRELTSRVLSETVLIEHKEVGQSILVFSNDGTYEARKLHFTQYWTDTPQGKSYLVYAEDSKGRWEFHPDGTITLEEPEESTCPDRKSGGDERISPHLVYTKNSEQALHGQYQSTYVAFETNAWIQAFHGYEDWRGEALYRSEVQWPPFPKDFQKPSEFQFTGLHATIHYGCLNKGFQEFRGNDQVYLVEEFQHSPGVDPWKLKPGTRLRTSP